jgi:hypothetical protein
MAPKNARGNELAKAKDRGRNGRTALAGKPTVALPHGQLEEAQDEAR